MVAARLEYRHRVLYPGERDVVFLAGASVSSPIIRRCSAASSGSMVPSGDMPGDAGDRLCSRRADRAEHLEERGLTGMLAPLQRIAGHLGEQLGHRRPARRATPVPPPGRRRRPIGAKQSACSLARPGIVRQTRLADTDDAGGGALAAERIHQPREGGLQRDIVAAGEIVGSAQCRPASWPQARPCDDSAVAPRDKVCRRTQTGSVAVEANCAVGRGCARGPAAASGGPV